MRREQDKEAVEKQELPERISEVVAEREVETIPINRTDSTGMLRCGAAPLFQPNKSKETHAKAHAQNPQSFVGGDSALAEFA